MLQIMTIRQQIEQALKRFEVCYGYLSKGATNELRIELHREFGPEAVATTLTAHFDELAVQMGYVKADSDKVWVSREALEHVLDHSLRNDLLSTDDLMITKLTADLEAHNG